MIEEFTETFPDKINYIEKTQQVGSATIGKVNEPDTTITATVSGVNQEALQSKESDTPILAGRWLDDTRDAGRYVCVVSEKFVQQAVGGSNADALGQKITLTINKMPYTFYISGVYKYVEDSYASMFGSTSVTISRPKSISRWMWPAALPGRGMATRALPLWHPAAPM